MATIHDLINEWRQAGPVKWAEDSHGWIDIGRQPITLEEWQKAILSAWWERRESIRTLAISNVKKTGKTLLNAVLTAWRWLALPGEHFCAANDLDQSASRQFAMISDMCQRNPFLRKNTRITGKQLTFTPTGSTLTALAVDAAGNSGANHLTVSHTEAWGIEYEQAVRAWEELTPPPGFFYGLPPLRIADSYAGFEGQSATWHSVVDRALAGELISDEWPIYQAGGLLLFHIEGEEAQERCFRGTPGQAAAYYTDERASFRGREGSFQRLHFNRRATSEGNFCDLEDWKDCFSTEHKPLPPGSKIPVYVGLDLATAAGGDNAALIGVYSEHGMVKVAFHKVWQNLGRKKIKGAREGEDRLKLKQTVYPYLLRVKESYNLESVLFDPHQALALVEDLRDRGVRCVEVPQTKYANGRAEKDAALQQLVFDRCLMVYPDPDLDNLSSMAVIEELPNGLIFIKKASRRQKVDLLVALSNCANEASRPAAPHISELPQDTGRPSPWLLENMSTSRSPRWDIGSNPNADEPLVSKRWGGILS